MSVKKSLVFAGRKYVRLLHAYPLEKNNLKIKKDSITKGRYKMVNHNIWINKVKWKSAMHEFKEMNKVILDCFEYSFIGRLEYEQQMQLIEFMGDSDKLNSLHVSDFCNFFLDNNIKFVLRFRICKKRSISENFKSFRIVKNANQQIEKIIKI